MNTVTPAVLEEFAADLVRRGLPVDYSQRAAAELVDHHGDLTTELRRGGLDDPTVEAESLRRLGESRTLAKKAVREFQRRFWCGRWRLTTFLLAPIPLLFLLWIATIVLYAALVVWPAEMLGLWGPETPLDGIVSTSEWIMVYTVQTWFLFVVPAAVMFGLARLATRAAIGWQWVAASACVLALSVCVAKCGFSAHGMHPRLIDGNPVPADQFVMAIGIFVPSPSTESWAWYRETLGRIILPAAIAAMVLFRSRQLARRREELVFSDC